MVLMDILQFFDQILIDISQAGWISYTFWGLYLIYPSLIIFLSIGFLLNRKTTASLSYFPKVTVLVSARNEEKDFPACIESLLNLDYPQELLQIILVNDRSEDGTKALVNKYASENDHVLALHTEDMPDTHLEAKARGVAWGMEHATGEWVFITDADAEVNPKWLTRSLSAKDDNTGMIGGAVVVKPKGFQGKLERGTWAFVQMFNLGMSGWGVPFACVGPNMAIRKDIYDKSGGLENMEFRIAEDLALLKMVADYGAKIITPVSPENTIQLKQVPSLKHYFSQVRRWFRGGIDAGLEYKWILYSSFWWGTVVVTFPFFGWVFSWPVFSILMVIQICVDIFLLGVQKHKLKLDKHIIFLPHLSIAKIVVCVYITVTFLFSRKIRWMGDDYSVKYD